MIESSPHVGTTQITCLLAVLKETQDTVRSYDTKSQICGVGFIFSIGIITQIGGLAFGTVFQMSTALILFMWLLSIGPIALYGMVLFSSRKKMDELGRNEPDILHIFYLLGRKSKDFSSYIADIQACDWEKEIAFEIVKVARLRDIKRDRFIRALSSSGISYLLVIIYQLLRSQNVLGF